MPTPEQHIVQARSNEGFAAEIDRLDGRHLDWRCTSMYYAALHYIQAYFSSRRPPIAFRSHLRRDEAIRRDGNVRAIWESYRLLKDWSERCRYDLEEPEPGDFHEEIDPSLQAIKRLVKSLLPEAEIEI